MVSKIDPAWKQHAFCNTLPVYLLYLKVQYILRCKTTNTHLSSENKQKCLDY